MIDRTRYDDLINILDETAQGHNDSVLRGAVEKIRYLRDKFECKLIVVGQYNAGKSSLLNGLIERPGFLKVAQAPQTALATELNYAEDESALAFRTTGEMEMLSADRNYTSTEYSHLAYKLPAEGLKKLADYTVVDMPGIDSGIEAHARALSGYIGTGSAYLVVIDQEKGGVDEPVLNLLTEISTYSDQIAVLINKADKVTEATVQSIADSAKATLESYGYPFSVYAVSAIDENIRDRLVSIVSNFRMQEVFDKNMRKCIHTEVFSAVKSLQIIKRKLYLDTYDLDCAIDNYKQTKEKLSHIFEEQKNKNLQSVNKDAEAILTQLHSALLQRSDEAAYAMLGSNKKAVEAIILETVRPIILSCTRDINIRQIDEVTAALDFSSLSGEEEQEDVAGIVSNMAENLKGLIDDGCFERHVPEAAAEGKRLKDGYHAVTGLLAIATDVIAPWMELVLVLLPDIISLVQKLLGESDLERMKHNFENNVIPQICNKLFPQVCVGLQNNTERILGEYEKGLKRQFETLQASMEKAKQDRQQRKTDFEDKKAELDKEVVALQEILKKVG